MVAAPRLENVLKRVEELEAIQKEPAALDALYETVLSKRTRFMALDQLEPVFAKFLSLAVRLRRGKLVKDGLHQYKKLVLPAGDEGVVALVAAVKLLLSQSEDAVARAQQLSEEVQVDDLDEESSGQSPQDLLLAMVSSEEAKDRKDREVVTPWLKLLWENYRSVLDVLRNNSKLEPAYASVASQAFGFCLKYGRKTEFRRLAELLRTHLQYAASQSKAYHSDMAAARSKAIEQAGTKDVTAVQIAMHMPQNAPQNPIDLSDGDTLQRFLDTRFEQLEVAVKLELWQEAFRSVEDVHTLLSATRRPIPISSMSTYYETLARVFAVSQNHLFHAATWFRYFVMLSSRRAPETELRRTASSCVLSLLCVPRTETPMPTTGRTRRWMALINLQRCPTRQMLIDAALARNVLNYASGELSQLFKLFEQDFNPLTFKDSFSQLAPALAETAEYQPYFRPLVEVAATTVFNQLSTTYTETTLDFVLSLVNLPSPFAFSKADLEKLLVRGSARGYRVRIDHQQGVVRFVDSLTYPMSGTAGALVRSELFELAKALAQTPGVAISVKIPSPTDAAAALLAENRIHVERQDRQNKRLQSDREEKQRIEEEQQRRRARAAEEERFAAQAKADAEEAKRASAQLQKDMAEIALRDKRALAESINQKGHLRVDMDKLDEMSMDQLQNMQVEQLDQEARSLDQRMATVARRYDHLERALRREEAKFWIADAESQTERDRQTYERRKDALLTGSRLNFDIARSYADRFARIKSDYTSFTAKLTAEHNKAIAEQRAKNAQLLEEAKAARTSEYKEKKRQEAAKRAEAEQKMAEQRKRDEEIRAEQQKAAEAEQRRRAEAAQRAEQIRAEVAAQRAAEQARAPPAAGKYRPPSQISAPRGKPATEPSRVPMSSNPFGRATPVESRTNGPPSSRPIGSPLPGKPASTGSPAPEPKSKAFIPPHLRK